MVADGRGGRDGRNGSLNRPGDPVVFSWLHGNTADPENKTDVPPWDRPTAAARAKHSTLPGG